MTGSVVHSLGGILEVPRKGERKTGSERLVSLEKKRRSLFETNWKFHGGGWGEDKSVPTRDD